MSPGWRSSRVNGIPFPCRSHPFTLHRDRLHDTCIAGIIAWDIGGVAASTGHLHAVGACADEDYVHGADDAFAFAYSNPFCN